MRRMRLCVEGICFLVITAFIVGGALIREINLLLVVAGILFGTFLVSARLLVRSMSKLEVHRDLPRAVGAGEQFAVRVQIANCKRRLGAWGLSAICEIRKTRPSVAPPISTSMFFPFVAAKETVERIADVRIHDRGLFEFGVMKVSSRFPLGLFRRTLQFGKPTSVCVYPRTGRLGPQWREVMHSRQLGSRNSQHQHGLTEGEFHGLRNWRDGDSARWIHWRTSAKRNRLTVRQFERQRNQDLAILLELRAEQPTNELVERAVRFAATVIAFHCRKGRSQLTLGIAGQSIEIVAGTSSTGLMRECLEKLAMSAASHCDQLPNLAHQIVPTLDQETRVVAVSNRRIDLSDTERFSKVWDQPQCRPTLSRVVCLLADEAGLSAYYADEPQPLERPLNPLQM